MPWFSRTLPFFRAHTCNTLVKADAGAGGEERRRSRDKIPLSSLLQRILWDSFFDCLLFIIISRSSCLLHTPLLMSPLSSESWRTKGKHHLWTNYHCLINYRVIGRSRQDCLTVTPRLILIHPSSSSSTKILKWIKGKRRRNGCHS